MSFCFLFFVCLSFCDEYVSQDLLRVPTLHGLYSKGAGILLSSFPLTLWVAWLADWMEGGKEERAEPGPISHERM